MTMTRQKSQIHAFTLVELLATMGILVLMMLFLFQFVFAAESAWSRTNSNTRVYENARVALDLIQRDLKSAIASDVTGQEIPFYSDDSNGEVVFVSATSIPSDDADSRLTEISYEANNNVLERKSVSDSDNSDNSDTVDDWDFYGETSSGWENNPDVGSDEVIGGVEDFSMRAYDSSNNPVSDTQNSLPAYVVIELSLFDENLSDEVPEEQKKESLRTFTKIVYLGD